MVPDTHNMRIGINIGNALLARRDRSTGALHGIAVDLARELARTLNEPAFLVAYESAGRMADEAKSDAWDAAFLAADPSRAQDIRFTAPYLEIEATYLVAPDSPLTSIDQVDRDWVRIAVSDKSAYDLALKRSITQAQIVRAAGVDASVDMFFADKLEALAGLRPLLVAVAQEHPGCRVLDGHFTSILQAIGTPSGRDVSPLEAFVREAKASGLVARIIEQNHIRGVTPAA